jgi:hypothetical protein
MRIGDVGRPAVAEGQSALDAMLASFEADLDARDLQRGTHLEVVVAGDGVRYRVVPWVEALASPSQRQLLAEQVFREAYGDIALSWTVRQHSHRYGVATLACALDAALLDRLAAMAATRGLKLSSVQPSLMDDFNRSLERIEPGWFWFVSIESRWLTVLLMSPTEPVHVRRLPSADGDLVRLLDREWFTLGLEQPRCPVYVVRSVGGMAETAAYAWRANSHWQFIAVPGPHEMLQAEEEPA